MMKAMTAGGVDAGPSVIGWASAFWAGDPMWTPPAGGGAVSSWRNGGASGGDALQATGSRQPIYNTTTFSGKPGITFDGSDDLLVATLSLGSVYISTVLIVKLNTTANNVVMVDLSVNSGTRYVPAMLANQWYARLNGSGSGVAVNVGSADTNPHMFSTIGRASGTTLQLSKDGTLIASTTAAGGIPDGPPPSAYIGSGGPLAASMTIGFFGVYVGDVEADPKWTPFKAWVRSHYGMTIA